MKPGDYVAIFREQLVILHIAGPFGAVVEFFGGITYMQCELGPASMFEILGEL